VHEATHVFNYCQRSLLSPYSGPWEWFDEGLAVFMEMELIAEYRDHHRFMGNWIEKPELSLDDSGASYQAARFIAYLAKRLGVEFVNRVWMESMEGETPFEAIARLLPKGVKLISADPEVRDLFSSGYCMDSWFMNDPCSPAYAPDLYTRFGERSITESFILKSGDWTQTSNKKEYLNSLGQLACKYYRFYFEGRVTQLRVEVGSPGESESCPLKAELALVTKDNLRARVIPLRTDDRRFKDQTLLTILVENIDQDEVDHIILVVTNCSISGATGARGNRRMIVVSAHAD
jgi:hypothetical protein